MTPRSQLFVREEMHFCHYLRKRRGAVTAPCSSFLLSGRFLMRGLGALANHVLLEELCGAVLGN